MGYIARHEHVQRVTTPRWLVVVVRASDQVASAVTGALGRPLRRREGSMYPAVVHAGIDRAAADRLAASLREAGAEIVVMETVTGSAALCSTHPAHLAASDCRLCRRPICASCRAEAGGLALCGACLDKGRRRERSQRLRQLLAVLGFVVFVAWVYRWYGQEERLLGGSGPILVGIFQFVEPEVAQSPLIRQLNDAEGPDGLRAIAGWLDAEHTRYTSNTRPYTKFVVRGPWVRPVTPPASPSSEDPWYKLLHFAWSYPRYFHGLAREQGIDPEAFGARVYVIYGKERGDLAADSRGSRKGRVAVSFIPANTSSVAYAQSTVAHELIHILGATDKYDEDTFLARHPEGYVQPWERPLYPQKYAEIMAVDLPLAIREEVEVDSLDQQRIGYRTAAEIGWIPKEQADIYYGPTGDVPEQALREPEVPADPLTPAVDPLTPAVAPPAPTVDPPG